jgi:CheY-like chemotaxis protein
VARILIAEPDIEVRELFAHAVKRLGHEFVEADDASVETVDAALVEPASSPALALARRLRTQRPELAIVIVSIHSRNPASRALKPVAHLVKPFERRDLEAALLSALNGRDVATSSG